VAIVGPTAAGKSRLALELARADPTLELVSVDSMCVYRGMDVGTAKPTPAERAEGRYHLIDVADPCEEFSVSRFARLARNAIAGIEARGHRAVLVGGTGLYLRAVVDPLEVPGRFPEVAARLEALGCAELGRLLAQVDPLAASRIQPNNRRRLLRALEVSLGSGRPFSSWGPGLERYPPTSFRLVGLRPPLELLDRRIEERFFAQMEAGWLEETRQLLSRPGGLSRTARQALGYRELASHLEEGVPLAEAVRAALRRTRRFARRQLAWFRRDPRITWHDTGPDPLDGLGRLLGELAR
jgi:tRNA dimethylallyltransferase